MSGIKWDNVVISTTLLGNQIVVGKLTKDKMAFADKSGDKTQQAVTAVYNHMKEEYRRKKEDDPAIVNLEFIFGDGSKLVYAPASEVKEGDE